MENENRTGRTLLIVLGILVVLGAAFVVVCRMDKRVRQLLYRLEYKLAPKKNAEFRVDL